MLSSLQRALVGGFALGLVVAIAPSCGGPGGGGSAVSRFCVDYSTAFCDYAVRCGSVAVNGKADCLTYFQGTFCGAAVDSAGKGYQTFDSTKAQACLSAIGSASCDEGAGTALLGCDGLFAPAADSGGACYEASDCKSATEGCGGASCARTCQAAGAQGQPCPRDTSCSAGLRCDPGTSLCQPPAPPGAACQPFASFQCDATSFCDSTTEMCTALPSSGQACRPTSPRCTGAAWCSAGTCQPRLGSGVTCTTSDACESTLFCDTALTPDSCQARKAVGGTCQASTHCQDGLRCTSGACVAARTAGQSCVSISDCATGLSCDRILRICGTPVYSLKAGDSCTDDDRTCGSGLSCKGEAVNSDGGVGTVGTCAAEALGDPCTSRFSSECPEHAFCNLAVDAGAGTCTAATSGSPCATNSQCRATDFCDNGLCAARKPEGAACTSSSGCVSPLTCLTSAAGAKTCGKRGELGAPCTETTGNSSCLFPLACTNGTCQHAGALNEPCLSGSICLSGACDRDAGICGAKLPVGGDCRSYGSACESGHCVNGKCEAACK